MQHPHRVLRDPPTHLEIEAMVLEAKLDVGGSALDAHLAIQNGESSPWFERLNDEIWELMAQLYAIDPDRVDLSSTSVSDASC